MRSVKMSHLDYPREDSIETESMIREVDLKLYLVLFTTTTLETEKKLSLTKLIY